MAQAEVGSGPSFLPAATPKARSYPALLGLSMRRTGGRRALTAIAALLLTAGATMAAFPAFTDIFGNYKQQHASANFGNPEYQTRWKTGHIRIGEGLTRLVIDNDRVQVNVMVVEGTTLEALQAGAGHYVDTPLPCQKGNVGIAGHRTTYGRPFNKLNYMHQGDTVKLITPFHVCTYKVVSAAVADRPSNPFIVQPTDISVVSQKGKLGTGHWLTLTSCNPLGSDAQRIVLRLRLVDKAPYEDSAAKL